MGRRPGKKPSFLKLVTDDFLDKFRVPQPFLKNFSEIMPKEVFFKRSMKCWVVKLEKIENELYFRKGLKAFVKDNHIKEGDYIVFRLVSDLVLNFTIYDETLCEKEKFNRKIIFGENISFGGKNGRAVEKKSAKLQSPKLKIGRDGDSHVNVKAKKLDITPEDPNNKECLYFTSIFRHAKAPVLPEWFLMNLGELKIIAYVKVAGGDYCTLELKKVDSQVLLKGWKNFLSKHSMRDGQPLKFKCILPRAGRGYEVENEEMDCLLSQEELGVVCRSGASIKEVFVSESEEALKRNQKEQGIYSDGEAPDMRVTKSYKISRDKTVNKKHYMKKKYLGMHRPGENVAVIARDFFDFMEDFRKAYINKEESMLITDIESAPYLDEVKKSGTEYNEYILVYLKKLAAGMYNEFDSKVTINKCKHRGNTAVKPNWLFNPYMIFMEEFRKMYMVQYPNSMAKENGIAGGEKWRSMTNAEKAPYSAEAEKRKMEYYKDLAPETIVTRAERKAISKFKRPGDMPKRPANQYMVFMEDFRKAYKVKDATDPSIEMGKAGGEKWKSMANSEKAPYVA